jgi:hypothetical protein
MATTKKAAKPKSPIQLLETTDPLFDAVYFLHEDQAAIELDALYKEMHRRQRSVLTTYAMCCAVMSQERRVRELAKGLRDSGQLLFAFTGTSALQGGAA